MTGLGETVGPLTLSQFLFYGVFLAVLAAATFIDLRTMLIPNRLILAGLAGGLPLLFWSDALPGSML